jgi:hypothetical protein
MQVRAADGTGRHFDDAIPRMLDFRIWNIVATNVVFAVLSEGLHQILQASRLARSGLRPCVFMAPMRIEQTSDPNRRSALPDRLLAEFMETLRRRHAELPCFGRLIGPPAGLVTCVS